MATDSTALANVPGSGQALSQADYVATLTMDKFKDTYLGGCTDPAEVEMCFMVMRQTGLNPVLKQIYFIERKEFSNGKERSRIVPQTSIDGLRLIAERSGKRDGEFPPEWCGEDGRWVSIWLKDKAPAAARVAVHKKGCSQPFYGVALYREYVQTSSKGAVTKFWREKPALMLAKCAEALAIRKAFPQETAGIYAQEEIVNSTPPQGPKASESEAGKRFVALAKERFQGDKTAAADWIASHFQGRKFGQLTEAEMAAAGDLLETELSAGPTEEAQWSEVHTDQEAEVPQLDHDKEVRRFMAVLKEKGVGYGDQICAWAAANCGWQVDPAKGRASVKSTDASLIRLASRMLGDMDADEIAHQLEELR